MEQISPAVSVCVIDKEINSLNKGRLPFTLYVIMSENYFYS